MFRVATAAVDNFLVATNGYRAIGVSTVGVIGAAIMLAAHRYNEYQKSAEVSGMVGRPAQWRNGCLLL